MTRRIRHALALAGVAVLLASCAGRADGAEETPSPTGPLLPATPDALPTMDAAGFQALLGELRGTPVVVNLWASWCVPCAEEAPLLADASRRSEGAVQFVGVDIQDNRDGAARFIAEHDLPYPSVFDPPNAIGLAQDLYAPPATLFYDAEGRLVTTIPGQLSAQDLQSALDRITAPGT